jgi:hypothetical protein
LGLGLRLRLLRRLDRRVRLILTLALGLWLG